MGSRDSDRDAAFEADDDDRPRKRRPRDDDGEELDDRPRRRRDRDEDDHDDQIRSVRKRYNLDRANLRSVALYQKGILVCILIYILAVVSQFFVPQEIRWILALCMAPVGILATIFVFLLATKVYSTGIGVLLGILTLIPCVGLIVLLIINSQATSILKQHGISVGLLGASLSDLS